jgi:hypothetical protein
VSLNVRNQSMTVTLVIFHGFGAARSRVEHLLLDRHSITANCGADRRGLPMITLLRIDACSITSRHSGVM